MDDFFKPYGFVNICRAIMENHDHPVEISFNKFGIITYRTITKYRPDYEYLSNKVPFLKEYDGKEMTEYLCGVVADVLDIGSIVFTGTYSVSSTESDMWDLLIQSDETVNDTNCIVTHLHCNIYVAFVKNKELADKINVMKLLS